MPFGPDFPWGAVSGVIIAIVTVGGVVFTAQGSRIIGRQNNQLAGFDQVQEERDAITKDRDRERRERRRAEAYVYILRKQLTDVAKIEPEPWPPAEKE